MSSTEYKHIIYGLIDPRSLMVRYIGQSFTGLQRIRKHRSKRDKDRSHCANWIRQLQQLNIKFDAVVLEYCDSSEELNDTEIWWIAYGHACGWPLTNLTAGGTNVSAASYAVVREKLKEYWANTETRARASAQFRERCKDPEIRSQLLQQSRKYWDTAPDARAKRKTLTSERNNRPEVKEAFTNWSREYHGRPEIREMKRAKSIEYWKDPEARARASLRSKRYWEDPEVRAKQAEQTRERNNRPEVKAAFIARMQEYRLKKSR